MAARSFEEVLDEIFNGKCHETQTHLDEWTCSEDGGMRLDRCVLTALCYIAWKLEEIDRKTRDTQPPV